MKKELENFIGVDISKFFFDVAVLKKAQPGIISHQQFKQSKTGFTELKKWLQSLGVPLDNRTIFCMEFTGIYNTGLVNYLYAQKAQIWVEMATRIKKSQGFERSSNDKTDSIKIAWYALRYQNNMQLWSPTDSSINKIKHFIAQRDRIVDTIKKLTAPITELKDIGCLMEAKSMEKLQKAVIDQLRKAKQNIETTIETIVNADTELATKVTRVTSIKGIGKVTAIAFLVYTKGFTSFETAKELACYCGVVPFVKKQSGISIKSKARLSSFANKKLKCLLHMCALSALKFDVGLKAFYERKVAEGKNRMSIINSIRNKLILRMFAVLRDDRNYVENYERKCA